MIDSTHIKAHRSAAGGKGGSRSRLSAARGGRNTKIHALADANGRLIAVLLTGGQAHDCPLAERLIRRVKPSKCTLGDAAYDSAELREQLDERGTKPVIPNRCNRKQPFTFNKRLYKLRWRIEAAFNRLSGLRIEWKRPRTMKKRRSMSASKRTSLPTKPSESFLRVP